jgi:hypothetical protein
MKEALQTDTVSSGMITNGEMGKILRELDLVTAIPNDYKRYVPNVPLTEPLQKTTVYLELDTNRNSVLKFYWANRQQVFFEERTAAIKIRPAQKRYFFHMDSLQAANRLRIDPAHEDLRLVIKSLSFHRPHHPPLLINQKNQLDSIRAFKDIKRVSLSHQGLEVITLSRRGQLYLDLKPFLSEFKESESNSEHWIETTIFQKKRRSDGLLFRVAKGGQAALASARVITKDAFIPKWPLLSVVIDEADLFHSEKGIVTNHDYKGKRWERLAYISYFEKEQLLFSTAAGVRLHGGVHGRGKPFNSFRLYFRKEYGSNQFAPGVLFSPQTEPLKRLVLHTTDWPPGWPFNNTLAYDIARQIGCIAPETKLAVLYLNGEKQGMYFLTPHQGRKQLRSFFGHDDFSYYRFKSDNPPASHQFYGREFWRVISDTSPLDMDVVGRSIDIDNLCKQLFAFVFCATTDYCQGVALKDHSRPDSKLFWAIWDMDHSFIDVTKTIKGQVRNREIWEQTGWSKLIKRQHWCGRTKLFHRLIEEDPAFKGYFARLIIDQLNHHVTAAFLESRVRYYEQMAEAYGDTNDDYFKQLRLFFKHRPAFLREEMTQSFDTGEFFNCRVLSTDSTHFRIDGYAVRGPYSGWYYKGAKLSVSIQGHDAERFSHWLINGTPRKTAELTISVEENLTIEPVFRS